MPKEIAPNPAVVLGQIIEQVQGKPLQPYQQEFIDALTTYCDDPDCRSVTFVKLPHDRDTF